MSIIILVFLIAMSAYFSATETAFSTCNKTRLKSMADDGNKRAALALSLAEKYDRLLSTILIGNNIVNISASSIATVLFVHMLLLGLFLLIRMLMFHLFHLLCHEMLIILLVYQHLIVLGVDYVIMLVLVKWEIKLFK